MRLGGAKQHREQEQWRKAQWREAQQRCSQEGDAGDESGTGAVTGCRVEGTQPGRLHRPPPPSSLDEAVPFRGPGNASHVPWAPGH